MPEMWPGLTNGQMREIALAFCAAIQSADCLEALPSDAWLDVRLKDHGCPEDQLAIWRAQIRAMRLTSLARQSS
jgi:hypothetical protein